MEFKTEGSTFFNYNIVLQLKFCILQDIYVCTTWTENQMKIVEHIYAGSAKFEFGNM